MTRPFDSPLSQPFPPQGSFLLQPGAIKHKKYFSELVTRTGLVVLVQL
jgi:hypothetical protein